ncbi:endonuclease III domain-containing protein [Actinomyces slackii]|uniref:3-methyladenine DNA glycosylase n=1 Tax=Actinomyces slackii TaxID=52774 RepID=A0A448KEV7_9ACTO|nr:hypothetical protein [Actinomyces slackii]VEG75463.1 3-methyladenine DNA glycosylase [Actinomyces slackii]
MSGDGNGDTGRAPLRLRRLLEVLRAELGTGHGWPADSGFEIMAGAVLVQNTAWGNALRSLERLRTAGALEPTALLALPEQGEDCLPRLIRPSGFMTGKSATLRALATWLTTGPGRQAGSMSDGALRSSLMGLRGVGPETADVISLYAYDRPRFIWDTYARRMLTALGTPVGRDYESTRRLLEEAVAQEALDAAEHQELHWLVLEAGKAARAQGGWPLYAQRLGLGMSAAAAVAPPSGPGRTGG